MAIPFRIFLAIIALAALGSVVLAQSPQPQPWSSVITNAPTATTPLGPSDFVGAVQGGVTKKVPGNLVGGGGAGGTPALPFGSLQFNNGGILGGYSIGSAFTTVNGIFNMAPGLGIPATPKGGLQFNNNGIFGSYLIGPSFSIAGGVFDLGNGLVSGPKLTDGAAAFNLGAAGGDLNGSYPSPSLAVGAASRNVGNLGNGLIGTLPNPSLNPPAVITAMGTPGGDLGGASYAAPLVTGLQGFRVDPTPPMPGFVLGWTGNTWTSVPNPAGINQTTGDVTCGPGSGSQPCVIAPGVVTNQKLAGAPAMTIKGNPTSAAGATLQDFGVGGGLGFGLGTLQINPTGVTPQQATVQISATPTFQCWSINSTGQITAIQSGACGVGGLVLTADDATTQLTGDDGVTLLTAEGGTPVVACTAIKEAFNVACNAVAAAL